MSAVASLPGQPLWLLAGAAMALLMRHAWVRLRAHHDEGSPMQQLPEDLRGLDRAATLGTLAAGVAHEINHPLTYVLSNQREAAAAIEGATGLDGLERHRILELLSEASNGTEIIRRIVRDIMSFARYDDERSHTVDVREVLDQAIRIVNAEIRHRATLVRDYQGLLLVHADATRLGQVFVNVLVNAAQALRDGSPKRDVVTVVAREDGPDVIVEVSDTGSGFSERALGRALEPFFTTKPPGEGTGLGLSVSNGIVARLGGSIAVANRPEGGATVRVRLPRMAEQPSLPARTEPATSIRPRAGRILLVDDEPAVRRALQRCLRDFDVTVATGGEDALRRIRWQEYDVVMCDLMMPDLSGMDLYERVAACTNGVVDRFVFTSGGAFTARARRFVETVNRPVLMKPFSPDEVRSTVATALEPKSEVHARGSRKG